MSEQKNITSKITCTQCGTEIKSTSDAFRRQEGVFFCKMKCLHKYYKASDDQKIREENSRKYININNVGGFGHGAC